MTRLGGSPSQHILSLAMLPLLMALSQNSRIQLKRDARDDSVFTHVQFNPRLQLHSHATWRTAA